MSASVKLGRAPDKYDQRSEQEFRTEMDRRDLMTHKRGAHLDVGGADFYVILYSPNRSRWSVTVSNLGVLTATAL